MPSIDPLDYTAVRGKAPGDQYDRQLEAQGTDTSQSTDLAEVKLHPMDSPENKKLFRNLLGWYYAERDRQAANRLEMAIDADFYDNIQWAAEDAAAVKDRGQMPLVYNEAAPMCDWVIGTERRSRVDWSVLPRTEDDVQIADVKTKGLKYVSDINRVPFTRSRSFADAVKAGVGFLDDGARDDPTKDVLYSMYLDWRTVLWDSQGSYELDLEDGRFVINWKWVDLDVGTMMFPDRAEQVRRAAEDRGNRYLGDDDEEDDTPLLTPLDREIAASGRLRAAGTGITNDSERKRVKLIQVQFKMPARVSIAVDGPYKGLILNLSDKSLMDAVAQSTTSIIDKVTMVTHVAVMTECDLLCMKRTGYRHNRFSITPIWCYRRGRDRLPYGIIRRIRDIQQDLNKRASKALFLLNTNQVIADEGAVEDWDNLRDEVQRPDGLIIKKQGKELEIKRDTDAATGQIQMMQLAAQSIQKSGGVNNENLGRQTNAVSGEAIKARQLQGSVALTEPFDNLRFAVQVQGEKQLSLMEQFYTEAKVMRITGARGKLDWVKINQPEQQPDGSWRYLNDITASQADFVVSEQDYQGTLRQVMFDTLSSLSEKMPPEVAMRFLRMAFEFSDLPNKDEMVEELRRITGEPDPNKELSPEEQQALAQQQQQQAEMLEFQRKQAMVALQEQQAKVRQLNAQAAKYEAEAQQAAQGQDGEHAAAVQQALQDMQRQAADEIESLSEQLRKAQSELTNRTLEIRSKADSEVERANIERDTKLRVAEIQAASDEKLAKLTKRMEEMVASLGEKVTQVQAEAEKKIAEVAASVPEPAEAPAPAAEPAPAPAPIGDIHLTVQVDATKPATSKTVKLEYDGEGRVTGGKVDEA